MKLVVRLAPLTSGTAEDQIQLAIPVQIGHLNPCGSLALRDDRAARRRVAAAPVAPEDRHPRAWSGAEDEIEVAVVVEVRDGRRPRRISGRKLASFGGHKSGRAPPVDECAFLLVSRQRRIRQNDVDMAVTVEIGD